jgi:AcrR family transcriptional regulator
MAEELLASLRIDPEPTARDLARQTEAARQSLYQRVGGLDKLTDAAAREGIDDREILRLLRRQARASLYLDRMVAPMLRPSEAELRNLHRTVATPFKSLPFDKARAPLHRWYVTRRLSEALQSFYQNARSRIEVTVLTD